MPPALLSTADAARLLRRPERAVRRWCATGLLPAQRVGARAWAVREEDLARFTPPRAGQPGRGPVRKARV